jgi:hypothetical protein
MINARWSWLTSLAVLFGGLTNAHAHVHYCFDGQEPPAAVHLADALDHTHEHTGQHVAEHADHHDGDRGDDHDDHDDLDLDLPNPALAKVFKQLDQPALASLPSWHAPLAALGAAQPLPLVEAPPTAYRAYLTPPSRGPPL